MTIGRCRGDAIEGMSSKEVFERIRDIALGLASLGVSTGDRVAIISESRPEWVLCDMAILSLGAVTVPIYPTLNDAQVRYILDDSGARLAIVSTQLQLDKVQPVRHLLPALEAVVTMFGGEPSGASVIRLDDVATRGHAAITSSWVSRRIFGKRREPSGPSSLRPSSTPPARRGSRKA